jgi:hypothetical protein
VIDRNYVGHQKIDCPHVAPAIPDPLATYLKHGHCGEAFLGMKWLPKTNGL